MEISQEDLKRLLDQVRQLTSRVERLEQLLSASEPAIKAATEMAASSSPSPGSQAASNLRPMGSPRRVLGRHSEGSSLEARIGSHWLNRFGIAAFLIAVSYFLKFAFENNWIGPSARVAIGVIAGIAIVLWSERFRTRGYQFFSYSLKAVGIGALYLSLWASFQVYHLLPSGVVFLCMVVVTGAACAMAVTEDAEILAWFAIAGGFSTPVLLSTGENREIVLFSYLALLDLGILAVAVRKPWGRLLFLGFLGTSLLYLTWYVEFYDRRQLAPTLIFASIFFVIFALAPLVIASREPAKEITGIVLAVLNAATYFLQAYVMITDISRAAIAGFTLLVAASYLLLERFGGVGRGLGLGQNLRRAHLALALGFITVAIPLRFENCWITIGWFVEAGALLWIGRRLLSDVLNTFALAASVLAIVRLLFIDNFQPAHLVFNMRLGVYALAIVLAAAVAHNASKRNDRAASRIGRIAAVMMNALALWALSLEVRDYYFEQLLLIHAAPDGRTSSAQAVRSVEIARDFTYSALWMAYGAMLMAIGFLRASALVRWQALVIIAVTTVKIFVYDTSQLDRIYRILSFAVLAVMLLAISFAYQRDWLRFTSKNTSSGQPEAEPGRR